MFFFQSPPRSVTATDCQTSSGQIAGGEQEQWIDGYGKKDFEKRAVIRRLWSDSLF